jgi:peptidoglycan hydrolase-like protein with peptidoglycan-binding domain
VAGPDTFTHMGLYELVLLKTGTSGEAVKKLQQALGVTADGEFGPGTERAVREYQQKNGLTADGLAGPETLARMRIYAQITAETVERSQVPAAMAAPPPTTQAAPTPSPPGAAPAPARRSIWDTVKGLFS